MKILLSIFTGRNLPNTDPIVAMHVGEPNPAINPHGPGHRFVWSEDLKLDAYDDVPQNQQPAGTHSGFSTTLRITEGAKPRRFYKPGSFLFHLESLYRFVTVPGTPLKSGQVIAEGVFYGEFVENPPGSGRFEFAPLEPNTLAITGGTGPYRNARGQITEPSKTTKLLDI